MVRVRVRSRSRARARFTARSRARFSVRVRVRVGVVIRPYVVDVSHTANGVHHDGGTADRHQAAHEQHASAQVCPDLKASDDCVEKDEVNGQGQGGGFQA